MGFKSVKSRLVSFLSSGDEGLRQPDSVGANQAESDNPAEPAVATGASNTEKAAAIVAATQQIIEDPNPEVAAKQRRKEAKTRLREVKETIKGFECKHIWGFCAGQDSQAFRGNPKYLFAYINNYRPDIFAYWLCLDEETMNQVQSLGYRAYSPRDAVAQFLLSRTGVIACEQAKMVVPETLRNPVYLNLWHGVGFKHCERMLHDGDLAPELSKKYIEHSSFYLDNQLFLTVSPENKALIRNDNGIAEENAIEAGYPRCLYQELFDRIQTFPHNILEEKGLDREARIVVFAPTYRASQGNCFAASIKDLERLYKVCEDENLLFIFKVHPLMETESAFLLAQKTYGDLPHFLFWDNRNDFYEIIDQVDLAIYDYSSIFADLLLAGTTRFIRYVYDIDDYIVEGFTQSRESYLETTAGKLCYSFDDLLACLSAPDEWDCQNDCEILKSKVWAYSKGKCDFDAIIQRALDFDAKRREHGTLYSFDIFDTVLTRKVLSPNGVFAFVQDRADRDGGFPRQFCHSYVNIRTGAEANVREYYGKSKDLRGTDKTEISFDEIFDRIQYVYGLNDDQIEKLKRWELECELENVVPLPEQIELIENLRNAGNKVIFVSDMYLSLDFIKRLIAKVCPTLSDVPIFLSSENGQKKANGRLFIEIYKQFEPFYDFDRWIHYGDDKNADLNQPQKLNIKTRRIDKPIYGDYQDKLIEYTGSYDSYLVAGMQARLKEEYSNKIERFVIDYVALCFVPYVDWVLHDATRRGYETLYFVTRDGHHLKQIADAMIEAQGMHFKTKLLYASRNTWRIPSYVDKIDEGFWGGYGNFVNLSSKEDLLKAMDLSEETFYDIFPEIDLEKIDYLDKRSIPKLVPIFRNSLKYTTYLLDKAEKDRALNGGYLLQEMNPNEHFAVVEYWGRGYNQDCHTRLWRHMLSDESAQVPYYYSRSVLPSDDTSTRYNFTTNSHNQFFIEAIFANMPYRSIRAYKQVNGIIKPAVRKQHCDVLLFDAMNTIMPIFAARYAMLDFLDRDCTNRQLYDFVFDFFDNNKENVEFAEVIGSLTDAMAINGHERQFAPPFDENTLQLFADGIQKRSDIAVSSCLTMSAARTEGANREKYCEMFQILPGDPLGSGSMLSEEKIAENKTFEESCQAAKDRSMLFAQMYKSFADSLPVRNNVVFVVRSKNFIQRTLIPVRNKIEGLVPGSTYTACMGAIVDEDEMRDVARLVAQAGQIVLCAAIPEFSNTTFRSETCVVMLPPDPFYLRRFGTEKNFKLKWEGRYNELRFFTNASVIQAPSRETSLRFKKGYTASSSADLSLLGTNNTDIYFTADKIQLREKVNAAFPESEGKKLILYLPELRRSADSPDWAKLFDVEVLAEELSNEFAMAICVDPKRTKEFCNTFEVKGFSKIIDQKKFYIRELVAVADVVIGDYRNTFFECVIPGIPAFSTAWDVEKMTKSNAFAITHPEDWSFCPVVTTEGELVERLRNLENYNFGTYDAMRKRYFEYCDGHSVERAVEYLLRRMRSRENDESPHGN